MVSNNPGQYPVGDGPRGSLSQSHHVKYPCRPDGSLANSGTNLRSGLPRQFVRVSARTKCPRPLDSIRGHLNRGKREVYAADLKGYFDTIPHDKLMAALEYRISDRSVLKLIRMWLKTSIEETDDRGRISRHRPTSGTPQGGVILPLLAIYLHWSEPQGHAASSPEAS